MHIEKDKIRKTYRVVFLFLCELGMVLQYVQASRTGSMGMLSCYFTMHSNMFCFLYFAYLLIMNPDHEIPWLKGMMLFCIGMTGMGYNMLLNGTMEASVGASLTTTDIVANTMLHTVVPIGAFLDYLFFSPKGEFSWKCPFIWLISTVSYMIFIFIRPLVSDGMFYGFSGFSKYPYPFFDVDLLGWKTVLIMIPVMIVGAVAIGYVLYGLDKLLALITGRYKKK